MATTSRLYDSGDSIWNSASRAAGPQKKHSGNFEVRGKARQVGPCSDRDQCADGLFGARNPLGGPDRSRDLLNAVPLLAVYGTPGDHGMILKL